MRVPNAMIGKSQAPNTNSKSATPAQATVSGASLLGTNPIVPSKQGPAEPVQQNKNSTLGIIGRSAAQMPSSIAKGLTSAVDSIADAPASIKNAVAQQVAKVKPGNYDAMQNAKKAAADYKKAANSHILGEGVRSWEQRVEESQKSIVADNPNSGVAKAGYFVNELGESVGAMAPSIIASAATAGIGGAAVSGATATAKAAQGTVKAASAAANAAKAAKAVSTATKAAGLGTMWVSVFDRSVDESVAQGNDYNASSSKAFWDATVEVATEMLTAGIPFLDEGEGLITKAGVFSKNALQKSVDKMAASGVQGKLIGRMGIQKAGLAVANSIVRMGEIASQSTGVKKLLLAGAGEAAEEMVAEVLGPVIERATTDPDAPNASIEDIMLAGLGGALISFAMAPLGNVQRFMKENPTREDVVNRARTQLFLSDPDMNLSLAADLVNGEVYGESQIAATQSLIGRSDMAETKGIPFIKGIQDNTRRNQANAVIQAAMDSKRTPADMSNMWHSLSNIWAEEYQYRMDYKLAQAKRDEVRVKYAREYDGVKTAKEKVSTLEGAVEAAQKAVDDIKAGGVRKNDPKLKAAEKALNSAKTALSAAQKNLTSEKEIALKKVDRMLSVKSAEDKYGADVVESFRGVEKLKNSRAGLAELTSKNGDTRVFNKQSYFLDRFGVTYEEAVAADKAKAAEMRAEVDKVFDDYRKQIRAKQDQIAADMNKAFADRGLQLRVEFDDSITSRGDYFSGVILLNRSRVQTELGARYVLAHEVLHGVMSQYPTAEQRALFYRDLDGAMAAIGYDFAAAKAVMVTVYEKKYTPRAEAEARRRKLSGEAKSQFIEQYLDNLCTEETYARFMQTAFGSTNILKALAEVSPDTLKKAADSLTDSSFGAMVNSIYDYERLLVLDKINKALVDPNFDPEAVKAAQEAALRAEEDARMEAERAEAERVAAEQRKLKEESQRAEDYEASLEWQAGMNPSSFLEEQARENIEMAEDVESQMAWQANIAMSSEDVGIEQPVDEAELWGYTEDTTMEGDVANGREGEVDVRYAEGNEKALFGRRNAGPAAGADEYRSSRRLASGRVWFEGNWKDGRKTAVKPAEYTNEFSYIADEADLPYFTREHLMPYVQAIGELAGHRYEQGKNLLITGDQLEVIGQDRYVSGYHNTVTGEIVATTYNRKPARFHSAIVHEALHDLYRSNNDVRVEFINELEKELVTEEAIARVLDGSVGTYAGGAYTKKFGKASDLYARRNTSMINNYLNELHSFLVSGDWMAFTGLSIEDQNALLRVRKKHLKYLDKQLKLKGITIGNGGKLSQLGILNTQSKYPQTYFGGQWDMYSEDLGYEDTAVPLYYKSERAIGESKQNKFGAASVVSFLKGRGVKSEEIYWLGLEDWLKDKKSVTKQELLEFIRMSHLDIKTKTLGEQFEDDTRWESYTIPGGENYEELLFKYPTAARYSNDAMSVHWGAHDVLAHARVITRQLEDGRSLFVEEIQSDWHNAGHKNGYDDPASRRKKIDDLKARAESLEQKRASVGGPSYRDREAAVDAYFDYASSPDSEYGKHIYDMLEAARREDFKYLASEEFKSKDKRVKDRLNELRRIMDDTDAKFKEADEKRADILKQILAIRSEILRLTRNKDYAPPAPFSDGEYVNFVLKNLLVKAANDGYNSISWTPASVQDERWQDFENHAQGEGLSGNLVGYTIEYDQDFPKYLNKIGKRFGAKAGMSATIQVRKSNPLYYVSYFRDGSVDYVVSTETGETLWTIGEDPALLDRYLEEGTQDVAVWKFPITDELRQYILSDGLPMFSEDLGVADFTMTEERLRQYEALKAKYGAQKKSGYKNGKFVTSEYGDGYQTPNKISDKTAVSQTYATAIGDKNLDDGIRERHMAAVLQGYASHFVITDESAKAYALNRLEGHKETSIKRGKKSEKNVKHRVLDDAYLDATNLLDGGRELSKNEIAYVEQVMSEYLGRIKEANDGALRPNETDNVNRMYDQYERLFAKYAAAGSRYGQNLQAFSMLKKMTPTGRLYYIESMTNHLVSELVDRNGNSRVGGYRFFGKKDADGKTTYYKDINGKLTPIKISEELRAKMEACTTQEEMDAVELEIIDDIAKQIPPTLGDRVVAWRYLAMLGNPRTHIRNIASNVAMGVTVDFKNVIAGGLEDLALGNQTEGRTKSLLHRLDPETKAAIKQFVDNDWNSGGMKERTLSGGHVGFQNMVNEQRNKLGVLDPLSKKNSQFLEWEDELSAKRAYTQAFLGYVAASNGKLTVDYLTSNTVESNVALAQARKYAAEEAQKATYRDASLLATRLNEMEKKMGPVGRIVVGGLLPFKKTPINIVKRGVEYSPAGLINGLVKVVKAGAGSNVITIYDPVAKEAKLYTKEMYAQEKYGVAYSALSKENRSEVDERFLLERYTDSFDAIDNKDALDNDKANSRMTAKAKRNRELCNAIDKIASGMTGTMILALGYTLAHMGIAKGGADEDKDLEYYDQMTGNQEYSVTIFGNNYTLDWLTPVSMPLFAGVEMYRALDGELDLTELTLSEALDILSHVADPVMNLSVLQGINDAMSSYDSGIGKFAQSAAESYIGQFIPTVSGQLARSIDPIRRTTYAPKDAPNGKELTTFANRLKNKVPGLSSTNAAYVDQWGRTQTNSGDTFIERLFANAVAPWYSKEQNRTAVDDYIVGLYTQTGDKGVIPKTPGSTYTIDSTTYYLASDEYQQTKQLVGQLSNLGVTTLMAIPGFSELDSDLQAELVSDAYSFARKVAQNDYAIAKGIEYDVGNSTQRIFDAISAGLTIGQALLISRLDNQIEGTKDKNGKTIRGSKKENTLRFYRSMGLTDAQIKAISTYDYE